MANNFIGNETSDIYRYFLKVAPDFSIFNLAEKYMIENNKIGCDKLFYFNKTYEANSIIETSFKRAMFRFDTECEITADDSSTFSMQKFKIGTEDTIIICISTTSQPIKFSIDKSCRVVGVAF